MFEYLKSSNFELNRCLFNSNISLYSFASSLYFSYYFCTDAHSLILCYTIFSWPSPARGRISSVVASPYDGSSLCCCWAEAERAKMLLRLDEISCHPFFQCGADSVKKSYRYHETIGFQLDGMLRKHQKIIVKNYRAVPDVSSLDFMFHGDSSQMFSNAEERLLRLVIDNACQGAAFNIIGRLMDSNALEFLDRESKDLQDIVRQLPNIWAAEVQRINSLKEARNLLDELKH